MTDLWFDQIAQDFARNILEGQRYLMLWQGLKTTLLIAFGASVIGVILGAVIALMRLSTIRWGRRIAPLGLVAQAYTNIIRGTPVLMQLMIMYYIILASTSLSKPVIAIITFGLNSAAYVSEIMRGGILAIDRGQSEAGRSLGLSKGQTMLLIVLPQSVRVVMPSLFNEFIMLVKETSVVGFIGLMDLTKAGDFIRSRTFSAFFPLVSVAVIYLVIVLMLTKLFSLIERKLRVHDGRPA